MDIKVKGIFFGILSAVFYGTNPLGALFLYKEGLNVNSVIFYRFLFASVILFFIMIIQKKSFLVTKKEILLLSILGLLFTISAITFYKSFFYLDSGIASTILFLFPVHVVIILAVFFKEKISILNIVSIFFALTGIILLYHGDTSKVSFIGVAIILISSISYAIYIIVSNKSAILFMSSLKITFYVSIFCTFLTLVYSLFDNSNQIQELSNFNMLFFLLMLAIIPTILSIMFLAKAIQMIGSTPTSITGAFEPLTAVFIGVIIFNEKLTFQIIIGISLIVFSVILIILGRKMKLEKIFVRVNKAKYTFLRYWKWK